LLTPAATLLAGAAQLGLDLDAPQGAKLLQLLGELSRWNRAYNLTAITEPGQMLTHHLLDSLSIHASLRGSRIADVGCGAGFPGLPLAVAFPAQQFTLIDGNNKKIRFVSHAVRELSLQNVVAIHGRVEQLRDQAPFDTLVTRAFAALPAMLRQIAGLAGPATRVLAMKGLRPEAELAAVPAPWLVESVAALSVPGLSEQRHLVILRRSL